MISAPSTTIKHVVQEYFNTQKIDAIIPILSGSSAAKNFKVIVKQQAYFIRLLPTQQSMSSRQQEALLTELAHHHQLGPQLYYYNSDYTVFIIQFMEGCSLSIADFHNTSCFNQVIDLIKTLHQIDRQTLLKNKLAMDALSRIRYYCRHADQNLVKALIQTDRIQHFLHHINSHLIQHKTDCIVHNDLNIENIFQVDQGTLYFIDWHYGGLGDPFLDLSMLAMLLNHSQRIALLKRYFATPNALQEAQLSLSCALNWVVFATWALQQIKMHQYVLANQRDLQQIYADKPGLGFNDLMTKIKLKQFKYDSAKTLQQLYEICLYEFMHFCHSQSYQHYIQVLAAHR